MDLAEVACVVVLQPLHVVVGEAVVVEVSEEDEGEGLCGGCGGQAHGREGGGAAGLKKNGDGRACRINVEAAFCHSSCSVVKLSDGTASELRIHNANDREYPRICRNDEFGRSS